MSATKTGRVGNAPDWSPGVGWALLLAALLEIGELPKVLEYTVLLLNPA